MHDARASVYEVRHTGYVPLRREVVDGKWGPWRLECVSGAHGVLWSY
jgi:hypothetical protein